MIALLAQNADLLPEASEAAEPITRTGIVQGYVGVFAIAFLVTLLATPVVRRLAISNSIVDHPSDSRKIHKQPIAYLGGVAIYLGLIGAVLYAIFATNIPGLIEYHQTELR